MSSGSRPAPLRIAAMGAGFWARFQLSAWREVPGVEIAALCDVERAKAEKMAHSLGIPRVFSDPLEMLQQVRPQLVDVITAVFLFSQLRIANTPDVVALAVGFV